jgi:hypothetical protein
VELEISNDIGVVDIKSETDAIYAVSVIIHVHSRDTEKYTIEEAEELTVTTPESNKTKISFISTTDIEVSTGLVTINLKDSTISELTLESSTGSKEITITNCEITDETPFIEASTGSIDISITDLNFTVVTAWKISSSTGAIDMTINGIIAVSGTHSFTVSASTGDVEIDTTLSGIGLKVTATVSTGTITLPGGADSPYISSNYDSAQTKIDFSINVSTGSITFTT